MEYRLLGPLDVIEDGRSLDIGGPRQQIVLAMLLLEANHVVSVSRLVAALWDDRPPATARSQVQICVSALRRGLAAVGVTDAIVTRPPGYVLRVTDDDLDIRRFERLAMSGRAAAAEHRVEDAARDLRAGLALWHGPAAAGVDSRIVQIAATRLNEGRLAALEDCIDLELDLGRHRDLIGELSELVAEYPLRERLRAQLMLALYRAGRQAEALASYRDARQTFVEELGLDLGEDLRKLEHAILENDLALNLAEDAGSGSAPVPSPLPVPRQLPAATADFTGRADVLDRLGEVLAPADDGEAIHVRVAALSGKSGVGKTALALHAAHLSRDLYPDGQLYAQLYGGQVQPASSASVLERFLRALGAAPAMLPSNLDDLAAMYRSLLADRRILVVLDDAYSAAQVLPLLPGSPSCAVIVTSRSRLSRLPGAHRFEIDVLDEPTGVELLARVMGPERVHRDAAAPALVRLCGHLPLALRIAAAKLAARPHWTIRQMVDRLQDEEHRLNELMYGDIGIRPSISMSYVGLTDAAKRLFHRLSILGATDFASWVAAPLLDADMEQATALMDQLVEAQLVEVRVVGGGPARFHLYELIRVYAVERLVAEESAAERTAAMNRLLRCWLHLASEAHRREYGGDFTLIHGDAEHYPLAAEVTKDLLADPLNWFHAEHVALVAAIRQAAQAGLDELCWDLAMTSVTLFESGSYLEDWQQTHTAALTAAREAGNRRGEAAMHYSLGALALVRQRLDDALSHLRRALRGFDRVGESHGRALALRNLAFADRMRGRYGAALDLYQEALPDLHEAGDLVATAHVLTSIAQIRMERREYDAAQGMLGEALAICRPLGVRRITAQTEYRMGELYLHRHDFAAAEDMFSSVLRSVRQSGDVVGETHALFGLGAARAGQRSFTSAEHDLRAALELSDRVGDRLVHGRILLALAELCVAQGQPGEAASHLDQAQAVFDGIGLRVWRARVLRMAGRLHRSAGRREAAAEAWRAAIALAGDTDPALVAVLSDELAGLTG